jgi:hypothetical protein
VIVEIIHRWFMESAAEMFLHTAQKGGYAAKNRLYGDIDAESL